MQMNSLCNDVVRHFLNHTNSRVTSAFSTCSQQHVRIAIDYRYLEKSQLRLVRYTEDTPHLPNGYLHGRVWEYDSYPAELNYKVGLFHDHEFQDGIPLTQNAELTTNSARAHVVYELMERQKTVSEAREETDVARSLVVLRRSDMWSSYISEEAKGHRDEQLRTLIDSIALAGYYPLRKNIYNGFISYI